MKKYTNKGLAGGIIAGMMVTAGIALGAGIYTNGLPVAGGTQYPTTLPLTGNETIPADTNLTQGLNPATEAITTAQMAAYSNSIWGATGQVNYLICGDLSTCPWQRGTAVSSDIANTLTYYADQWWNLGGASSAINVTRSTTAPTGFGNSLQFQRKSGTTDVAAMCMGQVLESANSYFLAGQVVEFSFWAKAGAGFTAASNTVTATIGSGTGADGSAAAFAAGTWTGYTSVASAARLTSTTWTRYSVVGTVGATAVQVGVKICFTPVGTAGASDYVLLAGLQLDVNPEAVASTGVSGTAAQMAAFMRETASAATIRAQRYFFRITETNGGYYVPGMVTATNVEVGTLPLPVTMRAVPTCTFTAGGLKWDLNGTDTAVTTLTCSTASTTSVVTIGDTTTGTVGWTAWLFGSNTTGRINITAEL